MSMRGDYEGSSGGSGPKGSGGTRVYVGGLDGEIKKEDLEFEFVKYGKLNSVWVAYNPPGFAFIEFAERRDAESACESMNNAELMGTTLRVEISRGRGGRGGGSRGGGGGRGRGGGRDDRGGGGGGFRGGRGRGGGGRGGSGGFRGRGGGFQSSRGEFRGGPKDSGPPGGRTFQSNGYNREPRYRSRSPVNNRFSSGGGGGRRDFGGDSFGRTGPSYPRNSFSNSDY